MCSLSTVVNTQKGLLIMGKDLRGIELGQGLSQRKDGRYEARKIVNGEKIDLYDMDLSKLRIQFAQAISNAMSKARKEENKDYTVREWFERWFETNKKPQLKNVASQAAYYRKFSNTICTLLDEKKLKELKQEDVQGAANDLMLSGYARKTVLEALGIFRGCLNSAVLNGVIPANPCVDIQLQDKNFLQERRVLSQEEQNQFLETVKGSYYYEAYKILLLTGMRIGEFSALQWEDVDFKKKEINIRHSLQVGYINGEKIEQLGTPKTLNSYRQIPFFGETEECFRAWKKKQNEYKKKLGARWRARPELGDLVFTTTLGSPANRYVITRDLNNIVNNINQREAYQAAKERRAPKYFGHLHPHAFRHTFATRCFEKHMDPLFIQHIMGHANYSTTVSYTHVLDEIKGAEIIKAGNFLDSKVG